MSPAPAGLLNLHKPPGWSSRQVVDAAVHAARTRRAGHAGTLDPLATGVLVVCLGWATRLVSCVQELPKTYRAEFLLGRTSDTDDITGEVRDTERSLPPERGALLAALPRFVGRIAQVPPAHSAVHVGGRRAYELARRGMDVTLAPRFVEIHRVELIAYEYPRVELEIHCGSGTYVRSLGRDLGALLGCGAVMSRLVRTAIGHFQLADATAAETLTTENLRSHLLPPAAAVGHWPQRTASPQELDALRQGRPIPLGAIPGTETALAMLTAAGELVALADRDEDRGLWQPRMVFPTAAG